MLQPMPAAPKIVSQEAWLSERKKLIEHEKDLTKQRDRVNAKRRRLPMVKIDSQLRSRRCLACGGRGLRRGCSSFR